MGTDSFPDGLTEAEFRAQYREQLEKYTPVVVARITALLARSDVGSEVQRVDLEVFPDECGDGFVSVCVYFEGPNRRVSKTDPSLYCGACVRVTEDLRVPLHDPGAYEFDTQDVSVATVIDWFSHCWQEAGGETYALPATITGHEGVGVADLRPLNGAARDALAPRRKRRRR